MRFFTNLAENYVQLKRQRFPFLAYETDRERAFVSCLLLLLLYLFFPFRLFNLPVSFGQIEEWTIACVALSIIVLLPLVNFATKRRFTFQITISDIILLLWHEK